MRIRLMASLIFHLLLWHSFAEAAEKNILILIHSRTGKTLAAAEQIKEGLAITDKVKVDIKRVASFLSPTPLPETIAALSIASLDELSSYDHIIFGSPVYFYGPAAEMMAFLQGAVALWGNQTLKDKQVATFFSSNGNGLMFANDALRATLRALHMDTATLPQACGGETTDFKTFGRCLNRIITNTANDNPPIGLPSVPAPVGIYQPFKIVGNLIYINQIALVNGNITHPGRIGEHVSDEEAKTATRNTMLNVLAVLNEAMNGDLSQVKQVVQISGYFNAKDGYTTHSLLLNEASTLALLFFGPERGKHTRGSFGVSSLPLNSPVEINAIFEIK